MAKQEFPDGLAVLALTRRKRNPGRGYFRGERFRPGSNERFRLTRSGLGAWCQRVGHARARNKGDSHGPITGRFQEVAARLDIDFLGAGNGSSAPIGSLRSTKSLVPLRTASARIRSARRLQIQRIVKVSGRTRRPMEKDNAF